MQYIYISFWDTIVEWLFNAILKPIVEWLGSLLGKLFSFLFNTILAPILKEVAIPIFEILLDLLKTALSGILYAVLAQILQLVDYMQKAFRIIIGLDNVIVFNTQEMPLTEALFAIDGINKAYWMLNFTGLTLAMVFAVYGVAQSAFDLDFEQRRPVSRVLSALFKSFMNLALLQLLIMLLLKLATVILQAIDVAMTYSLSGGGSTTLGRIVFAITSLDAAKNGPNISSAAKTVMTSNTVNLANVGVTDTLRRQYYYTVCPPGGSFAIKDYANIDQVEMDFNLAKMDFLLGYILAIFLLIIMGACLVVFVQRVMDMLVLYLASPFFVAMIPLDDGERFGRWRERFIGKCFSGFGMVMSMQLYVMLCPAIMDNRLRMSYNSIEFDYLCKMLFLVGGAWAILKSGNMITSLINAESGSSEAQTASVAAGAGFGMAMKAAGMGVRAGAAVGKGIGSFFAGKKGKEEEKEGGSNKFGGIGGGGGSGEGGGEPFTGGKAGSGSGLGSVPGLSKGGSGGTPGASKAGSGSYFDIGASKHGTLKSSVLGGMFKRYQYRDPKTGKVTGQGTKFSLGRLFSVGSDAKGKHVKLFGMGLRWDKNGISKVSLGLFSKKRGADGKLHTSKVNVLGCKLKANSQSGKMELSDIGLIGLHTQVGQDGKRHLTELGALGIERQEGKDGNFYTSSVLGGLYQGHDSSEEGDSRNLSEQAETGSGENQSVSAETGSGEKQGVSAGAGIEIEMSDLSSTAGKSGVVEKAGNLPNRAEIHKK